MVFVKSAEKKLKNQKSWDMPGEIKKIVEIDATHFVCLTTQGEISYIDRDTTKNPQPIVFRDIKFNDIAIDPKTKLCALHVEGNGIYAIDKNRFTVHTAWPTLLNSTSITANPDETKNLKLQCDNGNVIAWYQKTTEEKQNVANNETIYTGVKLFKTEFAIGE